MSTGDVPNGPLSAIGSEEGGTPRGLVSPNLRGIRPSESMLNMAGRHMNPIWEENPHIWQVGASGFRA